MRQERNLQRWMKELLSKRRVNPNNWRYITFSHKKLVIVHKRGYQTRIVNLKEESR